MTAQERIAIFHAYNGCDCKHIGTGRFDPKKRNPKTRNAILTPSLIADFYEGTFNISEFVLLLTDLSLISDEHKIAIGVILGYEGSGDGNCKHWAEWFIDSYGFGAKKQGNFHAIRVQQITDQLRLWNYNIGYSKYTAADLVNEGVVIVNDKNNRI